MFFYKAFDVTLTISAYATLYSGTKPSIISAEMKPCRHISLPLTDNRILGILYLQIVLLQVFGLVLIFWFD